MRRTDAGALVAVSGVFALWMGLSRTALLYVRPSTGRWLIVAGAVLVLFGLGVIILGRRRPTVDGGDAHQHHAGQVGWLLALPVAVAIAVGSNPLGSYAAGRQSADRILPPGHLDLEAYLNAGSFGGQAPALRMLDFVRSSYDPEERELLADTPVTLTGFVTEDDRDGHHGGGFLLTRFMVGCCAADAIAMLVRVPMTAGDLPEPDSWVEVEGSLDLEASPPPGDSSEPPVLDVRSIDDVDQPDEVYEYPP